MREYYVYIMANIAHTVYVGVTGNLTRRVHQHKRKEIEGFTARYGLDRLVYYESIGTVYDALSREKQIKGWKRARKLELVEQMNPQWKDLADGWYERTDSSLRSE